MRDRSLRRAAARDARHRAPTAEGERAGQIATWAWSGVALAVSALVGCVFGLHRIVDPDVFLHVVVGKAILAHPSSLGISTFLDPYPRYPYFEDKWLACVGVALASVMAGEHGLMVYQILLCGGVACAWYGMQRAWRASPEVAVVGVALALLACSFRLEPRPDTASSALLAILLALSVADVPYRSLRWMVPLTMAVWVNVHGYFINGILVLVAGVVCTLLGDRTHAALHPSTPQRTLRQQLVLLGLGAAACLLHPQGWHALAYPLRQLTALRSDPTLKAAIQEFTPSTDLLSGMGVARAVLLVSTALTAVLLPLLNIPRSVGVVGSSGTIPPGGATRSTALRQLVALAAALPWLIAPPPGLLAVPYRVTWGLLVMAAFELPVLLRRRQLLAPVLLTGFTALAVPLIRNLALVPPATLLVLAPAWTEASRDGFGRLGGRLRAATAAAVLVGIVVPVVWLRLSDRLNVGVRAPMRTGWGIDPERFSAAATDFVERAHLPGSLLNNFDVGSYLLYRLYPARRVFIAGSTSMYPASFLSTYKSDVLGGAPLAEIRSMYGTETVVLDLASPVTADLIGRLAAAPDWALVFLDHAGAVFVHVTDATRDIAARRVDIATRIAELASTERTSPVLPTWLGGAPLVFPRFNLGMFALAYGRPDLTLREARRLWDVAPSEDLAIVEGEAARRSQRLAEDLPRLERALADYPASSDLKTYVTLALAFDSDEQFRAGATGKAAGDARRMLTLNPDACGPYCALAKVAALEGDVAAARGFIAEAVHRDKDGTCRRSLGADPQLAPLLEPR